MQRDLNVCYDIKKQTSGFQALLKAHTTFLGLSTMAETVKCIFVKVQFGFIHKIVCMLLHDCKTLKLKF